MAADLAPVLTPDEVAALLQVRRSTVMELHRRGDLPSVRIGKHVRFLSADVLAYLDALRAVVV